MERPIAVLQCLLQHRVLFIRTQRNDTHRSRFDLFLFVRFLFCFFQCFFFVGRFECVCIFGGSARSDQARDLRRVRIAEPFWSHFEWMPHDLLFRTECGGLLIWKGLCNRLWRCHLICGGRWARPRLSPFRFSHFWQNRNDEKKKTCWDQQRKIYGTMI